MNTFSRFLLIVVSVSITLLFIEVGFRIYGYVNGIDFRLYSKEFKNSDRLPKELFNDSALKENAKAIATTSDFSVEYSINSTGFRDKEYSFQKQKDRVRIGMFGDSFTFGEGVPYGKRFSDIAETNISGVDILNFGIPGAGLDTIVDQIFTKGVLFNLDYVIVILNRYVIQRLQADISGLINFSATESARNLPVYENTNNTKYMGRNDPFFYYQPNFILRNSFFASYVYYHYSLITLRQQMKEEDKMFWNNYKECIKNDPYCDRFVKTDIELKNKTIELINKVKEVCAENGSHLVVINIDTEPLDYFYSENPPFTYLDLHTDLKNESKKYPLSFTYDHHYNEKTNEFLGNKMTDIIKTLIDNP